MLHRFTGGQDGSSTKDGLYIAGAGYKGYLENFEPKYPMGRIGDVDEVGVRAWLARGSFTPEGVSQRRAGQAPAFRVVPCRTLSDLDRGQTQNPSGLTPRPPRSENASY